MAEKIYGISELKKMADAVKLSSVDKARYVRFAIAWFNSNGQKLWADTEFGLEWAYRFKQKREYELSDCARLYLLMRVDGLVNARNRCTMQMENYNMGYSVYSPKNQPARDKAKECIISARKSVGKYKPNNGVQTYSKGYVQTY